MAGGLPPPRTLAAIPLIGSAAQTPWETKLRKPIGKNKKSRERPRPGARACTGPGLSLFLVFSRVFFVFANFSSGFGRPVSTVWRSDCWIVDDGYPENIFYRLPRADPDSEKWDLRRLRKGFQKKISMTLSNLNPENHERSIKFGWIS